MQRAIETLEGIEPNPDTPIPTMTVKDALAVIAAHRRTIEGGPRSRRQWARPRSLEEMRDSILAKFEAVEAARRAERTGRTPTRDDEPDL